MTHVLYETDCNNIENMWLQSSALTVNEDEDESVRCQRNVTKSSFWGLSPALAFIFAADLLQM